jgi:hypothetical protein
MNTKNKTLHLEHIREERIAWEEHHCSVLSHAIVSDVLKSKEKISWKMKREKCFKIFLLNIRFFFLLVESFLLFCAEKTLR